MSQVGASSAGPRAVRKCSTEIRTITSADVVLSALRRVLASTPLSEVARHAGMSRDQLSDVRDGERRLRMEEWLDFPPDARDEMMRVLGEVAGRAWVDAPPPAPAADDLRAAAVAVRAAERVLEERLDSVGSYLDRQGGAALEAACDELVRRVMAVREFARLAKREGVVGVK